MLATLCLNFLGVAFYLEAITGVVYGVLYCGLCLQLDSEIHRISEMTAFIIKTSKKYKFYSMFSCLGVFVAAVIYYNSELITWRVEQEWIINSLDECPFDEDFEVRLGIDDTFKETSAIFGIIGLGFGASQATKKINNVTWAYTALWKRILRGLLGVLIFVGIFVGFDNIPKIDLPTAYFFNKVVPHLLATFILYAWIPIWSNYLGLVQSKKELTGSDRVPDNPSNITEANESESLQRREERKEPLIGEEAK